MQRVERGVPGAEVVDVELETGFMHLAHEAQRDLRAAHDDALGDLQGEPVGGAVVPLEACSTCATHTSPMTQ